jgi:hypothetical protein
MESPLRLLPLECTQAHSHHEQNKIQTVTVNLTQCDCLYPCPFHITSLFHGYETVDNNRKERKSCRMYIIVMKQIDSFKHCSCHMCFFKDIKTTVWRTSSKQEWNIAGRDLQCHRREDHLSTPLGDTVLCCALRTSFVSLCALSLVSSILCHISTPFVST